MRVANVLERFPEFEDVLKGMPDDIELHIEKFQPDTIIVQKDDLIEKVMILFSGDMIVYNEYEGGDIIYVRSEGVTYIGDIELLSDLEHYVCSVASKNECSAIVMSCDDFMRWFRSDGNLSREIAVRLSKRNCEQAQKIGSMKYRSIDYRIIKHLCDIVKDRFDDEEKAVIRSTRKTLAFNVGASERMVHRVIGEMKNKNLLNTGYGFLEVTRDQYEKMLELLGE